MENHNGNGIEAWMMRHPEDPSRYRKIDRLEREWREENCPDTKDGNDNTLQEIARTCLA